MFSSLSKMEVIFLLVWALLSILSGPSICFLVDSMLFNSLPNNHDLYQLKQNRLLKTLWEKEQMLVSAFSPFPTMFSTLPKANSSFWVAFYLSSAYFWRRDRQYAGKKLCLNQGSNSQPPGHESDTVTTEPPAQSSILFWNLLQQRITLSKPLAAVQHIHHQNNGQRLEKNEYCRTAAERNMTS